MADMALNRIRGQNVFLCVLDKNHSDGDKQYTDQVTNKYNIYKKGNLNNKLYSLQWCMNVCVIKIRQKNSLDPCGV